ncbi:hypothetical protein PSCICL_05380 [Pseudomonas cichorii]|nr:hypothetical protein PSCICL_05380 [Pseudomonas cichorii]
MEESSGSPFVFPGDGNSPDTPLPPSYNKKAQTYIPGSTERVLFRWFYKGSLVHTALWHYTGGHRLRISPALLSQGI